MRDDLPTAAVEPVNGESISSRSWFCVQTHPKHEHIAANRLTTVSGFEVFNPQMRFRRATRRGPVWFTESTFPGYIFVRFDLGRDLDVVRYSASVSKIVHFNRGYPSIPERQMAELRALFGAQDLVVVTQEISPGDKVRIVGGAFNDLVAIVQQVRPAGDRVRALLEFLGRMTLVELDVTSVRLEERCVPLNHPLNTEAGERAVGIAR